MRPPPGLGFGSLMELSDDVVDHGELVNSEAPGTASLNRNELSDDVVDCNDLEYMDSPDTESDGAAWHCYACRLEDNEYGVVECCTCGSVAALSLLVRSVDGEVFNRDHTSVARPVQWCPCPPASVLGSPSEVAPACIQTAEGRTPLERPVLTPGP